MSDCGFSDAIPAGIGEIGWPGGVTALNHRLLDVIPLGSLWRVVWFDLRLVVSGVRLG